MGLGKQRARFRINSITQLSSDGGRMIYQNRQWSGQAQAMYAGQFFTDTPISPSCICLTHNTRLRLKADNQLLRTAPPFGLFMNRLLGRINALATVYGSGIVITPEQKQQYCKTNENGQLGFFHVLRSLRFCEILLEQAPILKAFIQVDPNQHWAELASCHHIPTFGDENYLKKIVQAADRFATAEREQGTFYDQGIHKRTRLESLLSRITLNNHIKEANYFLPLAFV